MTICGAECHTNVVRYTNMKANQPTNIDEIIREWIKTTKEVIYPATENERKQLKIERWRVKLLFDKAYNKYTHSST